MAFGWTFCPVPFSFLALHAELPSSKSVGPFSHAPKTITTQIQARPQVVANTLTKALAAGAIVPLRPALPPLDDLPDMVQTLLNTAAISL